MATVTPGRLWPKEADEPLWSDDAWTGMVLRTRDANGLERVRRVPTDRTLEQAMEWAAREYS